MGSSTVARAAIRYLLREGLGPLCPSAPPPLAVVVPGQRKGEISRRSDKFAPDYAPVTFIFIEILHSNERPYFSYRTAPGHALSISRFLLVYFARRRNNYSPIREKKNALIKTTDRPKMSAGIENNSVSIF